MPSHFWFGYHSTRQDDGAGTASLSGTATEGQVMTATAPTNDPDGASVSATYQWIRDAATTIGGATSSTYTLVVADIDHTVKCQVTYTDAQGNDQTVTTSASATVAPNVVPGSTTFDSGSASWSVPSYNTLTVEIWGAAAGGVGQNGTSLTAILASAASASSVSSLSMTANPGAPTSGGGTASGGNTTNTTGSTGGGPSTSASNVQVTSGFGAASPNGGAQVAGVLSSATPSTAIAGNNGNAPGGGASGGAYHNSGNNHAGYQGSGGGGYSKSVYTRNVTGGAPAIGASLSYSVGAGTAGGGTNTVGGTGANGRVKFTVA